MKYEIQQLVSVREGSAVRDSIDCNFQKLEQKGSFLPELIGGTCDTAPFAVWIDFEQLQRVCM